MKHLFKLTLVCIVMTLVASKSNAQEPTKKKVTIKGTATTKVKKKTVALAKQTVQPTPSDAKPQLQMAVPVDGPETKPANPNK